MSAIKRFAAVTLMVLGTLWLAPTAFWMWAGVRSGASVTVVGVVLNFAPGAFLFLVGATVLARPSRSTAAFWVSPLWVPAGAWIWAMVRGGIEYPAGLGVAAGAFAYATMFVVGLPLFAFLRARHLDGIAATAIAAGMAAALVTWLARALIAFSGDSSDVLWLIYASLDPELFTASALLGALAGATFWSVVRPDRLAAPAELVEVFS